MKSSSSACGRFTGILRIMVVASLLSGLFSSRVTWAQMPTSTPPPAPTSQSLPAPLTTTQPLQAQLKAWRASMLRTPKPSKGCFKATYPNTQWQEVPCTTAPQRPYPPARGRRPNIVGNGTDNSARVSGSISSAEGSFDSVTGVTSESGEVNGKPPQVANTFSLQLNTNFFSTSVCNGVSGCQGWQQFIFSNAGFVFMQYWLINYISSPVNPICPAQWNTSGKDCWKNSSTPTVPVQTIANLGQLSVTGNAASGGDSVVFSADGTLYSASGEDNVVNLAQGWTDAEFNIVGDCCSSEANFNVGSTIVVRTRVEDGNTNAPSCVDEGFTAETNSTTLATTCCATGGTSPAIWFKESDPGATFSCSSAYPAFFNRQVSVGNGLYYLEFPDKTFFGYYYLPDYPYLYHYGLGWEYVYDANDGAGGVFFYDFGLHAYLYTNPSFFPYFYDYSLGSFLYYYSGTSRYFYDFNTHTVFFSAPG
ncbi:MAG: hypothetical protein ACLQAT_20250 [Candidatus Binataceae bacterium]